jgi:hypothetical protein
MKLKHFMVIGHVEGYDPECASYSGSNAAQAIACFKADALTECHGRAAGRKIVIDFVFESSSHIHKVELP